MSSGFPSLLYCFTPTKTTSESSSCSPSLSTVSTISLLNFGCSNGYVVIHHCGFYLLLLMASDTWHLFVSLWPFIYFLLWSVSLNVAYFLTGLLLSPLYTVNKNVSLIYIYTYICTIFSPSLWFSFLFLNGIFQRAESFHFWLESKIPIIFFFCPYGSCFLFHLRNLCLQQSRKIYQLCFFSEDFQY